MMKLKTLKEVLDIIRRFVGHEEDSVKFVYHIEARIRAEAIKWVKEHNIIPFGVFCEFFNITEGDLK